MRINVIPVRPLKDEGGEFLVEGGYAVILDKCTNEEADSLGAGEIRKIRDSSGAVVVVATQATVERL